MRALVSPYGSLSHVHTLVAVALALRDAGHDVLVVATPSMAEHVRVAGLDTFELRTDLVLEPSTRHEDVEAQVLEKTIRALPDWVDQIRQVTKEWRPDVVVRDWTELASLVVVAEQGLRSVACGTIVRTDETVCGGMLQILDQQGLADDKAGEAFFGDLWLSFWPPSFAPSGSSKLPHEHHLRRALHGSTDNEGLPSWIHTLGDRPLVYVTFGTIFNRTPSMFKRTIEALENEDVDLLLTTGRDRDPATIGPLPSNVYAERYIPQTLVFPHCAAVLSHGGFNTVIGALSFGKPVACVPSAGDEPFNGRRCEELGVGLSYPKRAPSVEDSAARSEELDPELLRTMVTGLLEDPGYTHAAERLQAEIAALPDERDGVALIERLCTGR